MDADQERIALRLDTAARLYDVSPETLRYWVRTGRVPAFKLGRGWRIRVSDLERLLAREVVDS